MARTSSSTAATTIESETATVNYEEFVQDTLVLEYGYGDEDTGELYDLSEMEITIEVRLNKTDTVPLLSLSSTNNTVLRNHDIANGYNIKGVITDAMTLTLGPGLFNFFVKTKDANGYVNTLVVGTILLKVR